MATLEDKIFGEKLHYYCSSSEDECDSDGEEAKKEPEPKPVAPTEGYIDWVGTSMNTGPKGVLKDWQRYKQLENERRQEQEQEKLALAKKLSLSCQSHSEEEKARLRELEIEQEFKQFLSDEILEEFKQKRMQEMMAHSANQPRFGSLIKLTNGQEFLDVVDNDKSVNVIVFIYREGAKHYQAMYTCLTDLAADYPQVKFCCMEVLLAGMSQHFKQNGVPALLVYRNGNLIGNFVRLTDELGDEFVSSDIENYLLEHGLLPDDSLVVSAIRGNSERE